MTKWKYPKKWGCMVSVMLCFTILTACATNPTQNIVTNRNNGAFDIDIIQSETESDSEDSSVPMLHPETESTEDLQKFKSELFQWNSQFNSTDGTVFFDMNISEDILNCAMPVVEVVPHFWTEDDAKHIAEVLLGDQVFYEAAPKLGNVENIFSRAEMQDAVQRWSPYMDEQALLELFPNMADRRDRIELYMKRLKDEVANFNILLDEVSEERLYGSAEWKFQPDWKYMYPENDVPAEVKDNHNGNEQIFVTTTVNNIPYQLIVTTYRGAEYKLNSIFCYPDTVYSPMGIDRDIFRAQLCRTAEPTEDQVESIKENAVDMLNRMGIGTWFVDECYLENTNPEGVPEYVITMNAVPVFENVPAMYRTQLDSLSENYAPSYYLTEANLQFSANGDLVYFQLSSPVDVVGVVNENVAVMDMNTLMERATEHLTLSDYQEYGLSGQLLESYIESADEDLICNIDLSELDYGLIRIEAANGEENYYYVPGIILYGTVEYCGKDTGTVYYPGIDPYTKENTIPLIALNAINGSIINLNHG